MSLVVLSANDVSVITESLSPKDLLDLVVAVFVQTHDKENYSLPQRALIHAKSFGTLFMPSRINNCGTSIKVVSMPKYTSQSHNGLPATTLFLNERTGGVSAVINARGLTALRTAAGSLWASQAIGPSHPTHLVIFGAGKQSEAHMVLHLRTFMTIRCCTVVNRSLNTRVNNLLDTMKKRFPETELVACSLANKERVKWILSSADIICTTTPSTDPLIQNSWIKAGTHINLVGSYLPGMAEIDEHTIRRAGKILVDSREACLAEAGELIRARVGAGEIIEISEMLHHEGQPLPDILAKLRSSGDVTVYKAVGVGLLDTKIASLVIEKATQLGIGTKLDSYDQ